LSSGERGMEVGCSRSLFFRFDQAQAFGRAFSQAFGDGSYSRMRSKVAFEASEV
jgi:hypothetical protein